MSKHAALDTFGRSGNPAFGDKFEQDAQFSDLPVEKTMTLDGAVNKTGILLAICFTTAIYSWNFPSPVLIGIGFVGGFVVALVTIFRPHISATSAPIYAALERYNFTFSEAASDLYAPKWTILRQILIPIIKPGIIAGCILVFVPSLGAFLAPDLLGGAKTFMIGSLIEDQFKGNAGNWPFGAASSMILLSLVMIVV